VGAKGQIAKPGVVAQRTTSLRATLRERVTRRRETAKEERDERVFGVIRAEVPRTNLTISSRFLRVFA
jgi:hypothetical protein